jgi:hypothetical protein
MILKGLSCEAVDRTHMAKDAAPKRAVVNTVMNSKQAFLKKNFYCYNQLQVT